MTREIKFRIYNPIRNKMLHSDDAPSMSQFWMAKELADKSGIPNVMMQYTGLKDKKGKEIYEGDIIITANGSIDYIRFGRLNIDGLSGTYTAISFYLNEEYPFGECYQGDGKQYEVIGNIHENPELIK